MTEIIFDVEEADVGGYIAGARGTAVVTEADTLPELRRWCATQFFATLTRASHRQSSAFDSYPVIRPQLKSTATDA